MRVILENFCFYCNLIAFVLYPYFDDNAFGNSVICFRTRRYSPHPSPKVPALPSPKSEGARTPPYPSPKVPALPSPTSEGARIPSHPSPKVPALPLPKSEGSRTPLTQVRRCPHSPSPKSEVARIPPHPSPKVPPLPSPTIHNKPFPSLFLGFKTRPRVKPFKLK